MLTAILSRQRQKRLLDMMESRNYDAIVIGAAHHVYYFTAHLTGVFHESAFVLFSDGRSLLITANSPNKAAAADDVLEYEANAMGTLRQDQHWQIGRMICKEMTARKVRRIGADSSAVTAQVTMGFDGPRDPVDEEICEMRRVKDPDELDLMRKAISCCEAMYSKAREIIEPGVPELFVYAELHKEAVKEAGEPLFPAYLGNDFACGVPGGKPRGDRAAQDGELYILDLGPAYRGYFSDNARTFCVNRKPTDEQHQAWERVTGCLKIVEEMARPGVKCFHIFKAVDEHLKQQGGHGLEHHLGHGVGLQAHESPHLNPDWDETLLEGEVFTAEPGQYGEDLRGGIRIEQDYLVTADGVECLIKTPLDMI